MSAIRTEKHSNRKVLYISDKGEIVNVAKRYGIYLGDGRHPERTYYTLKSTLTALRHLREAGVLDSNAIPGSVSFECLDEKSQPLPGWHRVIDPQNPHFSIVGSKYQEKWLDKGWRQLERKINQSPLQFFEKPKSELQGGSVQQTRRQRRSPPIFHPEKEYMDMTNYDSYAQSDQKHLENEKQRQGWLDERAEALASLKPSAPASNPSVWVLVKTVSTQIKMVYHSFWASRVRVLNRHASSNK